MDEENAKSDKARPKSWWRYVKDEFVVDNRQSNGSLNLKRPKLTDASEWGQGKQVLEILNFKVSNEQTFA